MSDLYIYPQLRRKQEEFGCESATKTGGREWSYGNLDQESSKVQLRTTADAISLS